jgi:hypothetical protein
MKILNLLLKNKNIIFLYFENNILSFATWLQLSFTVKHHSYIMKIITSIKLLVLWLLIGFYSQAQTYSDWSNVVQATTPCPSAENLNVLVGSPNITFSWTPIDQADSYTLSYKSVDAINWTTIEGIMTNSSQVESANLIGDYEWKITVYSEGCEAEEIVGEQFNVCFFSWDENNLTNVIDIDGRVTKTGGTNNQWSAGAISSNKINATENGTLRTIISESDDFSNNKFVVFGLSSFNTSTDFRLINFAFYLKNSQLYIIESGVNKGLFGSVATNDELTIGREGTTIVYMKNGNVLREVNNTNQLLDLYLDVSLYAVGTISPLFEFETCNPFSASFEILSADNCETPEGEGSLKVIPKNGSGNYSFLWFDESSNDEIIGLGVGSYSVSIRDNTTGASVTLEGSISGSAPNWTNLTNVETNEQGRLTKTGGTNNQWSAGAISNDKVNSGEDGVLKTIISSSDDFSNNKFVVFGLSTYNTSTDFRPISYAFYLKNSELYIIESGANRGLFGNLTVNDELSISREGASIVYRKNGDVLRQINNINSTLELYLDASLFAIGTVSPLFEFNCQSNSPNTRESYGVTEETSLNDLNSELRAYPNPTNGELTLSYNVGEEGAKVEVYNLMGQRVLESAWEAGANLKQVDLGQQAKGMYIVKVVTSKETITEKVIVR